MRSDETNESRLARMGLDLSLSSGDVVLFSYLRAEGLRIAAAVGVGRLADSVLRVVRNDPKQQRDFLDGIITSRGIDYAATISAYGRANGVICWPAQRALLERQWSSSEDDALRELGETLRADPPPGSMYAVICGSLDGEEVTAVLPVNVIMSPSDGDETLPPIGRMTDGRTAPQRGR